MFSNGRQIYTAGLAIVGAGLRSSIFYLTLALLACLALPRPGSDTSAAEDHAERHSAGQAPITADGSRDGTHLHAFNRSAR